MKITDYINALPDVYKKDPESNNYKLLMLEQRLVGELQEDIETVLKTGDIHQATGYTLDLYGAMYDIARGTATDEQYRYMILNKAVQYMIDCDCNSIINAMSAAFGVPASMFQFRETENSAVVEVLNLPYSVLQNAGITSEQAVEIVSNILPIGVSFSMELSGTFEFGDSVVDYDAEKGFANLEQTKGGYFGYLSN